MCRLASTGGALGVCSSLSSRLALLACLFSSPLVGLVNPHSERAGACMNTCIRPQLLSRHRQQLQDRHCYTGVMPRSSVNLVPGGREGPQALNDAQDVHICYADNMTCSVDHKFKIDLRKRLPVAQCNVKGRCKHG